MANLPESATYDAGVYQLELTDPVQGGPTGVSNAPLKNLANRTAWLKSQIDGIKDGAVGLALYARLASPTFTGSPSAPTAALGDNTTKLATTAFVQETLGGFLSKSIAGTGSVTLTAVEAGNGIIEFTGALTGNRDVIVPSSPTRPWIIRNATTGAFSVTVKTAAGAGVVVAQGTNADVFCDGTNVRAGESWAAPLASPALTGNPTAPTAAQFNNDSLIATTAFVKRALGSNSFLGAINTAPSSILPSVAGQCVVVQAVGTHTLPPASSVPSGAAIDFMSTVDGAVLARQGTDTIFAGTTQQSSVTLKAGDTLRLVSNNAGWYVSSGSAALKFSAVFGSSLLSGGGYQRLPSGLIVQWGQVTVDANSVASVTLPISFSSDFMQVFISVQDTIQTGAAMPFGGAVPVNLSSFSIKSFYTASPLVFSYFAIGQ